LLAATVSGPLSARVAARIIDETGGNPLTLRELAAHLTPDQLAGRAPLPERLPVGRGLRGHFLGQAKMLPPATSTWLLLASAASGDDPAAPRLAEAGLYVAAQRLRASIAVFFSRHKDAPSLLLDAIAAVDPPVTPLIRAMLAEALQAALVARQYTVGTTPVEVARAALQAPRDPGLDPAAADLLLDGFATRVAVGYPQAVPLLRAAVEAFSAGEEPTPAGIPGTILAQFAADDLWDDQGRRAMFLRAEAVHRRHGALGALRVILAGLCTSEL
jgi:hypothetical protein